MIARSASGGCTISVRVHPGAKRNAITGTHDGAVKISLTTPPTDGRANQALIAFLAERLNITRASIDLLGGASSRSKTLRLTGITAEEAESRLVTVDA